MAYEPIADYAIIGDCRSAGLVSRNGSLDWLCLPRFDSPSVFGALLDTRCGGRFEIRPAGPARSQRRYVDDTNVLETTFETGAGALRLVDLMPVASEEDKRRRLRPAHELLRRLECIRGSVEVDILCDPRPDYGRVVPRLEDHGACGFVYEHGARALVLRSEVPLHLSPDAPGLHARVQLHAGDRRFISLTFDEAEPAVLPLLGDAAEEKVETTVRWWRGWAGRCRYDGPYRGAVVRSALALKLMMYAPSGAVVAAPTTSLPEKIGGVRNWDYRYCWLRDGSLTVGALVDLGYELEAEAFLSWMIHATRLSWPELQVMYDVFGETRLHERELPHLAGYAGSRPVRVGNGAQGQLQLDVYGQVIDAAYQFVARGGHLDRASIDLLIGLGRTVCRRWREPDEGMWEVRSGRRHHTVSKVMCWLALDRLLRLHHERGIRLPVDGFAAERDAVRAAVEGRGYSAELGSYVGVFDTTELDASLLLLGLHEYAEPDSRRMRGTLDRVCERLGRNGLLYRYLRTDDGLPPGEGTFGICSFWVPELRARQGEMDAARQEFEHILSFANDVGLFAEEIDPETGAALGNFPQAFTHVGLIAAALALERPGWRAGHPSRPARVREAGARV